MVGSRIFIGGIPPGVGEKDIEKFCKGYGRITEMFIKYGYCFVEFEDCRDADDAIEELHGKKMKDTVVTVQPARKKESHAGNFGLEFPYKRYERHEYTDWDRRNNSYYRRSFRTKHRLIVKNLSSNVGWKELKDYMRKGGEVTYCEAHKKHIDEGVIEFASNWDMENAIRKLDDTKLSGKRIHLVEDCGGEYGSPVGSTSRRDRSSESAHVIKDKSAYKYSRSRSRSNHRNFSTTKARSPSPKKRISASSICRPLTPMERTPTIDASYTSVISSRSKELSLENYSPSKTHRKSPSTKCSKRSRRGHQKDDSTSSHRFKQVNPFRSRVRSVSQSN